MPGIHCGSAAIRNVMRFYGYDLSEEMCFGLGSGMGFYYTVASDQSPTRLIFARGPLMECNFFRALSIQKEWKQDDDADRALETLKEWIRKGVPCLVQTDIYYMRYYGSSTHFPGHVVVVWGYDEDERVVYLSDTAFPELQPLDYDSFKKARTAAETRFVLRNNWFEVDLTEPLPPLERAVPRAIRTNALMMVEGRSSARGVSSVDQIRRWAQDLPRWKEADDWRWCARFGYQVLARRGVDGAGFRAMYASFLREAEELVPALRPLRLAARMEEIAALWREAAAALKLISELEGPSDDRLAEAARIADELWRRESAYYGAVLDHVARA